MLFLRRCTNFLKKSTIIITTNSTAIITTTNKCNDYMMMITKQESTKHNIQTNRTYIFAYNIFQRKVLMYKYRGNCSPVLYSKM